MISCEMGGFGVLICPLAILYLIIRLSSSKEVDNDGVVYRWLNKDKFVALVILSLMGLIIYMLFQRIQRDNYEVTINKVETQPLKRFIRKEIKKVIEKNKKPLNDKLLCKTVKNGKIVEVGYIYSSNIGSDVLFNLGKLPLDYRWKILNDIIPSSVTFSKIKKEKLTFDNGERVFAKVYYSITYYLSDNFEDDKGDRFIKYSRGEEEEK